ncbi:MAG: histidine ammonia-lyase [Armatimonadetes bacterium]|nr:histidine ammonia-lyase [Armatimonadota bacterium]
MFTLNPGQLTLADLRDLATNHHPIQLPADAWERVERSAKAVEAIVAKGDPAYGINTGFGKLAKVHIPDSDLSRLQDNLIRSHAVGVGPDLDEATARLIAVLKIGSLAQGFSGVRRSSLETAIAAHNAGITAAIPSQGSVGASGDLAPLAHYTLMLMGEGSAYLNGQKLPALEALQKTGIESLRLGPKEGLAFINGTQVSTAIALQGLFETEKVFAAAVVAGALSVDAAMGSDTPFDPRIHEVRGQPEQIEIAAVYRDLLAGSEIRASHLENDERVQDPYSLRCQPQVMGAVLQQMRAQAAILHREANGVTDNPLVFADSGDVLSGGNFHAEPVAFAADALAIACAEIGGLSERRIALLIDSNLSGLPPFLVANPGLNSGFMIAHVTAAALVSENKTLAHPSSVDSLPTSANQEDHVSMATFAARKLRSIAENVRQVVAIELLAAAQGVDFHRPLRSSEALEQIHASVRARVAAYDEDRYFAPDIAAAAEHVSGDEFAGLVGDLLV